MSNFSAIVAMSENRVIGRNGRIPWHLPEDLKWFKKTTIGNVVVMGRKTFESIGKPLPGRENVVLSRAGFSADGVIVVKSLEEILEKFPGREVFICGGAQVYMLALPYCSTLYVTYIKGVYEGDTFFPPFETDFEIESVIAEYETHRIVKYKNLKCCTLKITSKPLTAVQSDVLAPATVIPPAAGDIPVISTI
ncbi:MAG: dihydrofolate reductase [Verrucomicrobiia bacterium]